MSSKLRYAEFSNRLDLDAFYDAIGFEPMSTKGDEDTGHCLDIWGMHKNGDQTGKFSINREKKVYNCFVCGGGSLLSLVIELHDMDPEDATKWIYQFTRTEQTLEEFYDEMERLLADPDDRKPVMPYYNERVLDRDDTPIAEAVEWSGGQWIPFLKRRGISATVAHTHKLRYNPAATRFCPAKIDEDNYVGPAITFPHYWRGRLVGWQQRWLEPEGENLRPKWVPKYTNTPDFPKAETIFNYDRCVVNNKHNSPVIIVESVPTVLYLESLGIPAVATFGGPKEAQMKLLRIFNVGILIAPDADEPGIKGRDVMTDYLDKYIPVSWLPIVDGAPGADLGDLSQDELYEHLEKAGTPLEFKLAGT
jgi:hypothetical protein